MAPEPQARSDRSLLARLDGYLERHAQVALASLGRLAREPLATLLTVGVIALALALPAGLWVAVENARAASAGFAAALDLTMYLKPGLPESEARQLAHQIEGRHDVAAIRLVTASEGLKDFREWSGLGAAVDALGENPLPHAIVVRPRRAEAQAVEALAAALRAMPNVDLVQIDTAWVERFLAVLELMNRCASLLAVLLAVAVLIVVGNTIRLDIDARRQEIEVTKLVGGSDGFVRRPFLYGGLWYGLAGGLLAALLVEGCTLALAAPVAHLASTYGSVFEIRALDARAGAVLVAGAALLGWLGAFVSASRHLRQIEPSAE
jgi:cell division transport system permease protein